MNLVHFLGLNCYLNCVVSIAAFLGLRYEDAFATLWSEADLYHDTKYDVFTPKRMLTNLAAMGAKLSMRRFSATGEVEAALASVGEGEPIIVAMDAFDVPWSPIYQALHDPHYFIACKGKADAYVCFDPTYGKRDEPLSGADIIAHAGDIGRMERVAVKPLRIGIGLEAREVLRTHPQARDALLARITACADENRKSADLLARYVDGLINNRYLFKRYVQSVSAETDWWSDLFDGDFFARWAAVKNGLFKASLVKGNEGVLREVCGLLCRLFDEEMELAARTCAL